MTERHGGRSHGSEPGAAQAGSSGAVRAGCPIASATAHQSPS